MSKYLFFISAILFTGCTSVDKLACYNSSLKQVKKSEIYTELMESAREKVPIVVAAKEVLPNYSIHEMDKRNRNVFVDSSVVSSTAIDEAVFFNRDSTKCVLLVLLKTVEDAKFDEVLFVQGTLTESGWSFSPHRLPSTPMISHYVRKPEERGKLENNSFEHLSKKGRKAFLISGRVKNLGCNMDYEYWFGE